MELRLEKIERDGFSGIHPNLESAISINKLEKELASSVDDVMQLSSVLGKNCCIVFFNESGVVNKKILTHRTSHQRLYWKQFAKKISSNMPWQLFIIGLRKNYRAVWKRLQLKLVDSRNYFHQISGDLSISGKFEPMQSSSLVARNGKCAIMEFFAKVNNFGEDIGKLARESVQNNQTEETKNYVKEWEVKCFCNNLISDRYLQFISIENSQFFFLFKVI